MFNEKEISEITAHGLTVEQVEAQIEAFKRGFPSLEVVKAASPEDGIVCLSEEECNEAVKYYEGVADTSRNVWTVYVFLIWYKQYFEEVSAVEIKEDTVAEVEAIAETESAEVSQSTISTPDPERLDALFGLAFDDEDGAGVDENILSSEETEETPADESEE